MLEILFIRRTYLHHLIMLIVLLSISACASERTSQWFYQTGKAYNCQQDLLHNSHRSETPLHCSPPHREFNESFDQYRDDREIYLQTHQVNPKK